MISHLPTIRRVAPYLTLSIVLVLGIVQWSFLPLLVQNAHLTVKTSLDVSDTHTSKFAAPFKYFHADPINSRVPHSTVFILKITAVVHSLDVPAMSREDHIFARRQFRSPPAAV